MLKTNKSALYRRKINYVALVLGTYLQIVRHRLTAHALACVSDIGLFTSSRRH